MKKKWVLNNQQDKVAGMLRALFTDKHLSRTFEGTAKNGKLHGLYTNMALLNGMVVGFVKIKGHYSREEGSLSVEARPSNYYWFLIILISIAMLFGVYKSFSDIVVLFIVIGFCVVFIVVMMLVYFLERTSFFLSFRSNW